MPADKTRDDLPSFQQSEVGRRLAILLMARAARRQEQRANAPLRVRAVRVRKEVPQRTTQNPEDPSGRAQGGDTGRRALRADRDGDLWEQVERSNATD